MHSFQPSRGRILFEFACALGIVASCVGAAKQTGAPALLLAAFVAGLYGFVRLFDLAHGKPAEAAAPQEAEPEPELEQQAGIRAFLAAVGPEPAVEAVPEVVEPEPEAERVEAVAAEASHASPSKSRRKSGGRKPKAAEEAKVVELVPPESAAVAEPAPLEEADVAEPVRAEEVVDFLSPEDTEFAAPEEAAHPQIAPLFEPDPFARMQRRAFGRRGRI